MVLKSLFDHPEHEVHQKKPLVIAETHKQQNNILKKEFDSLKIPANPAPPIEKGSLNSNRSHRNAEALENVHELVRGLNRP
jgi:hypothetical protein